MQTAISGFAWKISKDKIFSLEKNAEEKPIIS